MKSERKIHTNISLLSISKQPSKDMTLIPSNNYHFLLKQLQTSKISLREALNSLEKGLVYKEIFQLCLEGVKHNGMELKEVLTSKKILFTAEEYKAIYLAAVRECGFALKYVPYINQNLLKNLFQKNREYLRILLTRFNFLNSAYPEIETLKCEEYKFICQAAVQTDISALRFILDDAIKSFIINQITLKTILLDNYTNLNYISKLDYKDKEVNDFLSSINNVVVVQEEVFLPLFDKETEDAYLVYANSPHRVNQTIRVDSLRIEPLLQRLKKLKINSLTLTLLGHSNSILPKIAAMGITDIIKIIEKNTNIKKIVLLGCDLVKSNKLAEEQKIIQYFIESQNKIIYKPTGFVLMIKEFLKNDFIINKMLDHINLDAAYILAENDLQGEKKYILMYIERITDKNLVSYESSVNQKDVIELQNIIRRGKNFLFPCDRNLQPYVIIRTSQKPFTEKQTRKIFKIFHNIQINLDRRNEIYKEQKNKYPFLGGMSISQKEAKEKLQSCMLKELLDAIESNPKITHAFSIKGYTNSLFVDTKEQCFHMAKTCIYSKENYNRPFFKRQKDNINRDKLQDSRDNFILDMALKSQENRSIVKSITVDINEKPDLILSPMTRKFSGISVGLGLTMLGITLFAVNKNKQLFNSAWLNNFLRK